MEYKCQLFQLSNLITATGIKISDCLCNNCCTGDCSNPVELKTISIVGVNKKGRFFMRGDDPYMVLQCEGFMLPDEIKDEDD